MLIMAPYQFYSCDDCSRGHDDAWDVVIIRAAQVSELKVGPNGAVHAAQSQVPDGVGVLPNPLGRAHSRAQAHHILDLATPDEHRIVDGIVENVLRCETR